MFKLVIALVVLAVVLAVAGWIWRTIRAWRRGDLPGSLPGPRPRRRTGGGWRVVHKQHKDHIEVRVEHPRHGVQRRWKIESEDPASHLKLAQAMTDAQALASELQG